MGIRFVRVKAVDVFLVIMELILLAGGVMQSSTYLHMQPNRSKIPFPDGEVDGGVYLLADVGADG